MSQPTENTSTTSQELEQQSGFSLSNNVEGYEAKEPLAAVSDEDDLLKTNTAVTETSNENELSQEDSESWQQEFEEALIHIQSLGAADRKQILENARLRLVELQQQDDAIDMDLLTDAFEYLRGQIIGNDYPDSAPDDADADVSGSDEGESEPIAPSTDKLGTDDIDSHEEKLLEEYYPGSVDDLEREIQEAMQHVRRIGNYHGRELVDRLSDTFYETNGREPDTTELHDIFCRLQQSLLDEAADELLDDIDENNSAAVQTGADDELTDADIDANNNECPVDSTAATVTECRLDNNESDDSDYQPTVDDEQTEAAREAELLAEYEADQLVAMEMDGADALDNAPAEINVDEIELPSSLERSLFVSACDRLQQITTRNVTQAEVDSIIHHLQQINLEETDPILTAFDAAVAADDDENDSDYVPNEDEEQSSDDAADNEGEFNNEDEFEARIDS